MEEENNTQFTNHVHYLCHKCNSISILNECSTCKYKQTKWFCPICETWETHYDEERIYQHKEIEYHIKCKDKFEEKEMKNSVVLFIKFPKKIHKKIIVPSNITIYQLTMIILHVLKKDSTEENFDFRKRIDDVYTIESKYYELFTIIGHACSENREISLYFRNFDFCIIKKKYISFDFFYPTGNYYIE